MGTSRLPARSWAPAGLTARARPEARPGRRAANLQTCRKDGGKVKVRLTPFRRVTGKQGPAGRIIFGTCQRRRTNPQATKNGRILILQGWTPDDNKLLVITIAATVAANIITVVIVALAVIIARSVQPHPGTPGNYAFFLGTSIFPVMTACAAIYFWRRSKHEKDFSFPLRTIKWAIVILGRRCGVVTLLDILSLDWLRRRC